MTYLTTIGDDDDDGHICAIWTWAEYVKTKAQAHTHTLFVKWKARSRRTQFISRFTHSSRFRLVYAEISNNFLILNGKKYIYHIIKCFGTKNIFSFIYLFRIEYKENVCMRALNFIDFCWNTCFMYCTQTHTKHKYSLHIGKKKKWPHQNKGEHFSYIQPFVPLSIKCGKTFPHWARVNRLQVFHFLAAFVLSTNWIYFRCHTHTHTNIISLKLLYGVHLNFAAARFSSWFRRTYFWFEMYYELLCVQNANSN